MEILKVFAIICLPLACFILIMFLGYIQATFNMTEDEKKAFDEYISKNGFLGNDDYDL